MGFYQIEYENNKIVWNLERFDFKNDRIIILDEGAHFAFVWSKRRSFKWKRCLPKEVKILPYSAQYYKENYNKTFPFSGMLHEQNHLNMKPGLYKLEVRYIPFGNGKQSQVDYINLSEYRVVTI